MSSSIFIDETHISNSKNSEFTYTLPKSIEVKDNNLSVALASLNVFFSWPNVTSEYGNNKFSYTYWDMSGNEALFDIEIKDGYYSVEDIYNKILSIMYTRGHYLEHSTTGDIMYLFQLETNPTYYACEFTFFSMGKNWEGFSGVDGWSMPTTWNPPDNMECMSFIFPNYGTSNKYFGFTEKTVAITEPIVNASTTTLQSSYTISSDVAPQVSPSSAIIVLCNLCNNELNIERRVLNSFVVPSDVYYGDTVSVNFNPIYTEIANGHYDSVKITLVDQQYRLMNILDPVILFNLSVVKN